jgi:cyclohexyl-isocyanide hydratase
MATDPTTPKEITIGMLAFPGMQPLDMVGPLDFFVLTPGLRPIVVAQRAERFTIGPGLEIAPEATFRDAPKLDVLFVPGGVGISGAIKSRETLRFLADRAAEARYVTSVCVGALVLGAARLLRGYRATTHWRYRSLLPLVGAEPVVERVVRDRNRITGGGVTAGIDFGLELISILRNDRTAEDAQLGLEYDPHPPFDAGSPATAPEAVVDDVLKATQKLYDEREALLRNLPRDG